MVLTVNLKNALKKLKKNYYEPTFLLLSIRKWKDNVLMREILKEEAQRLHNKSIFLTLLDLITKYRALLPIHKTIT